MNFQDFFRNFVGLNRRNYGHSGSNEDPVNKFKNPPWGDDPDEDDDFDELYTDYRRRSGPGNDFGFNIFTGDVMEMHKYFEHQMSEMMKSFGSFGLGAFDFPQGIEEIPGFREDDSNRRLEAPRDRYLKSGLEEPRFSTSRARTDTDLDHRISEEGIGALFKKDTEGDVATQRAVLPKTFSSSFTSRITINKDGRVEEKVREWKSDGSERETVRRQLGDESHIITTTKDSSGQIIQEEKLNNLDEGSLPDFNKKWSWSRTGRPALTDPWHKPPESSQQTPDNHAPSSGSLLSSIWRLFS